jgi:DNA polymerase III subunit epsilon
VDEYLALIDRVLEDRRITAGEADALLSLAEELGLSCQQAVAAHEHYLSDLVSVALADGVLSETEKCDLEEVRRLLGISEERSQSIFQSVQASLRSEGRTNAASPDRSRWKGKTICFTGQLMCSINGEAVDRAYAERIAAKRGMIPRSGVTMDLDYLVAADPDSMSGKAKKARKYDVRIIAEPVFWQMVGVQTD